MIAAATTTGASWPWLVAAAVFLVALAALVVDRARLKRQLSDVERSEALLETDLADTRRELDALRGVLRDRAGSGGSPLGAAGTGPTDPGATVG